MPKYRIEFQLGVWACEIEADNEDAAYYKAEEYAIDELNYDIVKHADCNIKELDNA